MAEEQNRQQKAFKAIENDVLNNALNELGRLINITTTYGSSHPAVKKSIDATIEALRELFIDRKKLLIGSFNGVLTVDETAVQVRGALQKSLERRLVSRHITGLRISQSISGAEVLKLVELLSDKDSEHFEERMAEAGLENIVSENTSYQAVRDGQTVAHMSDLAGAEGGGLLVLDDDLADESGNGTGKQDVHVEQIVAFLKGDVEIEDSAAAGDELSELSKDPNRLGKMIMESVAIRQAASELAGESLGDIILGCLRRTYSGLRKQSAFQSAEGKEDLRKALLLLEESILDQMRDLTGDADPELDRQIVQAVREMDENLGFESTAMQYMNNRAALEENSQELQAYIKAHGAQAAKGLLSDTEFPPQDWKKIVIDSKKGDAGSAPPINSGLHSLVNVFDKLEQLMKSKETDGGKVKDLLGQASYNLDGTLSAAKAKLQTLSDNLIDGVSGTIGGQALQMDSAELLKSLSEIAQELMQPLTAINASLEMMMQGYVGEFSDEQEGLLDLASNSGEHLTYLMRELIDIVGCPVNKGVDDRYHTTSDEVMLKIKG